MQFKMKEDENLEYFCQFLEVQLVSFCYRTDLLSFFFSNIGPVGECFFFSLRGGVNLGKKALLEEGETADDGLCVGSYVKFFVTDLIWIFILS